MNLFFKTITILVFSVFAFSCGKSNSNMIHIAAASNIQFALSELAEEFKKESGVLVNITYGSSGNLANQIINGAPYDIFVSANNLFMDNVLENNLIETNNIRSLLTGKLILGVNNSRQMVSEISDLKNDDIETIVIATPSHAPFGIAAEEYLKNVGIYESIKSKLVYAENIRQCMIFVQSGNADAGFLSANLPIPSEINTFELNTEKYTPPIIKIGILNSGINSKNAKLFYQKIINTTSFKIFEKYNYRLFKEK